MSCLLVKITYAVPSNNARQELIIKQSRFIAEAHRVCSREDAMEIIHQKKQEHPKANHVCYAFVAGAPDDAQQWGFSDDGEPNGTAGNPILNVLSHSGVGQILVTIVRYFGGVKLGTGGLVRAYGSAANEVLDILPTKPFEHTIQVQIVCEYATETKMRHLLETLKVDVDHGQYSEKVSLEVALTEEKLSVLQKEVAEKWPGVEVNVIDA